jgi:hypothetical protein
VLIRKYPNFSGNFSSAVPYPRRRDDAPRGPHAGGWSKSPGSLGGCVERTQRGSVLVNRMTITRHRLANLLCFIGLAVRR